LTNAVAARLSERSVAETVALLRAANVPVSRVRTVAEALSDPQVEARDMIQSITHPTIGEVRLLGIPFKFSDSPASIRRHPPLLGEHTAENHCRISLRPRPCATRSTPGFRAAQ
jgi:formyl-CoA transferase